MTVKNGLDTQGKYIHYCAHHHGFVAYDKLDPRFVGTDSKGRWLTSRCCPACFKRMCESQRAEGLVRGLMSRSAVE